MKMVASSLRAVLKNLRFSLCTRGLLEDEDEKKEEDKKEKEEKKKKRKRKRKKKLKKKKRRRRKVCVVWMELTYWQQCSGKCLSLRSLSCQS